TLLAIPLTLNGATTLEAWTNGRGGDGLASRSAETVVVHDDVAPSVDVQWPIPGASAGVAMAIRTRADDAGSGVAEITASVDGRALATTVTPSLPGTSITATATWDGAD